MILSVISLVQVRLVLEEFILQVTNMFWFFGFQVLDEMPAILANTQRMVHFASKNVQLANMTIEVNVNLAMTIVRKAAKVPTIPLVPMAVMPVRKSSSLQIMALSTASNLLKNVQMGII